MDFTFVAVAQQRQVVLDEPSKAGGVGHVGSLSRDRPAVIPLLLQWRANPGQRFRGSFSATGHGSIFRSLGEGGLKPLQFVWAGPAFGQGGHGADVDGLVGDQPGIARAPELPIVGAPTEV